MSLHYILDGYNILKQMPAFRDLPLEEARRGFLSWIDQARPQGSVNNRLTVVFDGAEASRSLHGDVRVIFSGGPCADDRIKLMVQEDALRKNCVVVSDDKDVFLYARSLGARVMKVAAFTSKAQGLHVGQKAGRQARHQAADGKYIPLSRQEKINKELSSLWLKEKP